MNQLCRPGVAEIVLIAAQHYHLKQAWFLRQILLMPDHLHALIAPAPNRQLAGLVGDWKRFTARKAGVEWQKNFFEHRLRSKESWEEKAAYIRANPQRAGLCRESETWPYQLEHT